MRLWLKPDRMSRLGISPTDVFQAVQEQNLQAPAGQIGARPAPATQQFQYSVQVRGQLEQVAEFENIIVRALPDGSFVRVKDIARVELGAKDYFFASRFNGKESAAFSVNLTPDASAIETAGLINAELKKLAASFPTDLAYDVVIDNTIFVKASLEEVVKTFFEALVLVLVVVFVFLQSWRATLIPMLAVPVSLVATFAAFTLLGFTINTLTLFGMVLAIGIVVDDAIVVVEAVEHHMHASGLAPREATIKAMEEVSGPVVAIALILAAVFVPVAFLGGIAGVMYQQFAITVAVSTGLSALVALTLTPALCAMMLKPKDHDAKPGPLGRAFGAFNRLFDAVTARYGNGVARAIRGSLASLALLAILIFAAFGIMQKVPGGFVPPEDQGYFIGSLQLPAAASMNRTLEASAELQKIIDATPGVKSSLIINGYSILTGTVTSDAALFVVSLQPWAERTSPETQLGAIIGSLTSRAQTLREASVLAFNPPPIPGLGATGGFAFKLQDRSGGTPLRAGAGGAGVHHGRAPAPRDRQRLFQVQPDDAGDPAGHRPREGQEARRADQRSLAGAADLPGRRQRQRLLALRPQLQGLDAGRARVPLRRQADEPAARAQQRRRDGAAECAGDPGADQRAHRAAALQPVAHRRHRRRRRAGLQLGRRDPRHGGGGARGAARRLRLRVERHQPAGEGIGRPGAAGLRLRDPVRLPVPGRALRELVGAVRGAVRGAAGHLRRHGGVVAHRAHEQHLRPDRHRAADRSGGQECDPDRRVREDEARRRRRRGRRRDRGRQVAPAADHHDLVRLHPRRGAADPVQRRRCGVARVDGRHGLLGHAGGDAAGDLLRAGAVRDGRAARGTLRRAAPGNGHGGIAAGGRRPNEPAPVLQADSRCRASPPGSRRSPPR